MATRKVKDFVCVGQFAAPHGLKGAIRLKSFTETPEGLKAFRAFFVGDDLTPHKILFSNPSKGGFLVTIDGVSTPEGADRFKGKHVFVKREDFKPLGDGEFYLTDLEGLAVKDTAGAKVGRAEKVYDFGAGAVLEIALEEAIKDYGKTLMVPFKGNAISEISLKGGYLVIDLGVWLEGEEG